MPKREALLKPFELELSDMVFSLMDYEFDLL